MVAGSSPAGGTHLTPNVASSNLIRATREGANPRRGQYPAIGSARQATHTRAEVQWTLDSPDPFFRTVCSRHLEGAPETWSVGQTSVGGDERDPQSLGKRDVAAVVRRHVRT